MQIFQPARALFIMLFTGFGSSLAVGQATQNSYIDTQEHPISIINGMVRKKDLKTIYIFPNYILRSQNKSSEVLIGKDVLSKKIWEPDQIIKFSKLFLEDVKYTPTIPERIPKGADRNVVLFISSGKVTLDEWYLFKLESGWWFMKQWNKPKNEKGEFTSFMKCGDKMGKFFDSLVE